MIYADSDATINPFNDWLVQYGIWIAIGVAGAVFLFVLGLFLYTLIFKKKPVTPVRPSVPSETKSQLLNAVGGKANIVSSSLNGSRIVLVLNNYELVNDEELKKAGVDSFIKMSNKLTLVSRDKSEQIYLAFKD